MYTFFKQISRQRENWDMLCSCTGFTSHVAVRVWLKVSYSVPSLAINSSQILVSSSISWFCETRREGECLETGVRAVIPGQKRVSGSTIKLFKKVSLLFAEKSVHTLSKFKWAISRMLWKGQESSKEQIKCFCHFIFSHFTYILGMDLTNTDCIYKIKHCPLVFSYLLACCTSVLTSCFC